MKLALFVTSWFTVYDHSRDLSVVDLFQPLGYGVNSLLMDDLLLHRGVSKNNDTFGF